MIRRYVSCLVSFLLITMAGCMRRTTAVAQATVDTPPRFVGRTVAEADGAVRLAWGNTQIITAFDGPSIAVKLEAAPDVSHCASPPSDDTRVVTNMFDVSIDGRPPSLLAMRPRQSHYVLADNLSPGHHTLTLTKRTEPLVGEVRLLGFALAPGCHLLPPPPPRPRRLEFIGDSITAGYGNEGANANCRFTPLTENGAMAFGPLAARTLGAEASVIAWSGRGLIRNRDLSTTELLPELYTRTIPSQASPPYNPDLWHPDAVIINLGTNDFAPGLVDAGHFESGYVNFVTAIRKVHPKAHVFLGLGPMLNDDFPKKEHQLSAARALHEAIVAQLKALGDSKVTMVEFEVQNGKRGFGCDWHPSLATHAAMAAQLAHVIQSTLGW